MKSRESTKMQALVDGYTRFQTFIKVVLPSQAVTGIAATAVFCLNHGME